jgi:hypothetical protein
VCMCVFVCVFVCVKIRWPDSQFLMCVNVCVCISAYVCMCACAWLPGMSDLDTLIAHKLEPNRGPGKSVGSM